jgi:hypothetical protein
VVLTPEAVGGKESARGAIAPLLAELARREHRHAEMRPKTSTKQGKSTALGAAPTPPRPQPNAARYPGRIFGFKIFGGKEDRGGVPGRDLPWGQNGIGENMEVGSGPGINYRGEGVPVSGFTPGAGKRGTHRAGRRKGRGGRRSMDGCVDVGCMGKAGERAAG